MSNGTNTFPVKVKCASGATKADPTKLAVQRAKGTRITVEWEALEGHTFPEDGFFSWKAGSERPPNDPQRSTDGKKLTLEYDITKTVTWSYNIKLEGCTQEDPDIENEIPPGEEFPPRGNVIGGGQQGGGQTGGGQQGGGQQGGGQTGGGQTGGGQTGGGQTGGGQTGGGQ